MIITCSQCQTRFKVSDDKLAAGPIRVRCSKCNFVFMAGAGAPASQPPSASLPPTSLNTLPPRAGTMPPLPAPPSPTPRPTGPITGMFEAFGAPSASPSPSGFGAPNNRSGIFMAPSNDFQAPTADPFAGFAPPAPPPPPSAPPPLAPRASPADPFGRTPTPFSSPAPAADPFAAVATAPATPHAKDPFGLSQLPGFASPSMPLRGATPAPLPPRGLTPAPLPPRGLTPAPLYANAAGAPVPALAPNSNDPFAQTEGHNVADLFGAGSPMATDPFGGAPTDQNAGPGNPSGLTSEPDSIDDPFATLDAPGSLESMTPTGPPSVAPPPPPPDDVDPFADLDIDADHARAASADATDDPFDRPPPPRAAPRAPAPSASSPAVAAPALAAPLPPVADRAKLKRLETAQRVRAVAWGAAQVVIFGAFLAVAVVFARGGSLEDLSRGDLAAAMGGTRVEGGLAIAHARLKKRTLPSGLDVVIVSGEVRNTTEEAVPGALVEVRLGSQAPVAAWAWSKLDPVELASVTEPAALTAIAQRAPASASLAPGERAPFVLVAPAPADGLPAAFSVQARSPPAAAPASVP